jgi:hypothetical protein
MSAQSNIAALKDSVGIVREVAVIVVVVGIIVDPGFLVNRAKSANEAAKQAGAKSTEFNLGFEKVAFDNTTDQTAKLEAALKENEALKKRMEELISTSHNAQTVATVREVLHTADSLTVTLQQGISSTKTAALAQDQLIQQAETKANSGPGAYGIVVSADKQNDQAVYEAQQALKLHVGGMTDVTFYKRQGFLRTVVRFPGESAAQAALPQLQSYRKTVYPINLDKWCPKSHEETKLSGFSVIGCD